MFWQLHRFFLIYLLPSTFSIGSSRSIFLTLCMSFKNMSFIRIFFFFMFLSQILKPVPMCGLIWCTSGVSTYNVEIANKLQTGEWFQVPDLALRDHYLVVPLDYENPKVSSITIFVREVVAGMQPRSSCSFPDINSMCDVSGTFI